MIKRCYECLHWQKGTGTELWGKCVRAVPNLENQTLRAVFPVTSKQDRCGEFSGKEVGSEMYGYDRKSFADELVDMFEKGKK